MKHSVQAGVDRNGELLAPLADARFLVALVVLIVNDQYLKTAYGNWLTGKLSDVAGLIILPVVVGVAFQAIGLRRYIATACGVVGLWFAAMKVSAVAAARTEWLFEVISRRPSTIVVDPTDLLGLAGLIVAARVLAVPRPLFTRRQFGYLSLVVAAFACTATSGPEYYETDLGIDSRTGEVIEKESDPYAADSDGLDPDGLDPDGLDAEASLVESDAEASLVESGEILGHGEFATQACLSEADGGDCFRIVDGRIERQASDGEWKLEWAAFDIGPVQQHVHGGWGPSIRANDIVAAPDGTVHVGFFDEMGPIVRSSDGQWSPGIDEFRPLGWLALIYIGLIAAALAGATPLRTPAGFSLVAATVAIAGVVITWAGLLIGFGVLAAVAMVGVAVATSLFALVVSFRRKASLSVRRLAVSFGALAVGLVLGLSWKLVLTAPQNLYVVALLVSFVGVVASLFVPRQPPPPPRPVDVAGG